MGTTEAASDTRRQNWQPDEVARLRELFDAGTVLTEIARDLNRSQDAVRNQARKLGLSRPRADLWQPDEIARLRDLFEAGKSWKEIARDLNRSQDAVRNQARSLGLSRPRADRWQPDEIARLRELFEAGKSWKEIARDLNRTPESVGNKARSLGIFRPRPDLWQPDEIIQFRELFGAGKSWKEIAHDLNRTPESVKRRACKLGFSRPRIHNRQPDFISTWTPELLSIVKEAWLAGETLDQISARTGKCVTTIGQMAKRLGLPSRKVRFELRADMQKQYDAGVPLKDIARQYNVIRSTMAKVLERRGDVLRPELTDAEKEIIEDRFHDGCTGPCIARRVRRGSSTISDYIRFAELSDDRQELDDLVRELRAGGLTVDQVALKLELPRKSILYAIKRNRKGDR